MNLMILLGLLQDLKQFIDPETILGWAGEMALPVLILIIFAETGLMIGFFLPGDSLLFLAGMFTASGHIHPTDSPVTSLLVLVGSLMAAAVVGDQVGYLIGRKMGRSLFNRPASRFFNPKHIHQTKAFYDRHGGKTIMIGRFIPIVRTFAPVVAGVTELEYRRFVVYNVIGGVVWIASMTCLGYLVGEYVRNYIKFVTIGIILISVIPIITTWWKERRNANLNK